MSSEDTNHVAQGALALERFRDDMFCVFYGSLVVAHDGLATVRRKADNDGVARVLLLVLLSSLALLACGLLLDVDDLRRVAGQHAGGAGVGGAATGATGGGTSTGGTSTGGTSTGGSTAGGGGVQCTDPPPIPMPPKGACLSATATCPEPCAPPEDPDCDGLEDSAQDPWPGQHSQWLMRDDFDGPTLDNWKTTGSVSIKAGEVTMLTQSSIELVMSCHAVFDSPDDLVEVAFRVDAVSGTSWSFWVYSAETGSQQRVCRFWQQSSDGPYMQVETCNPPGDCTGQSGGQVVSNVDGRSFLIQTWSVSSQDTHHHRCRLLSLDGKVVLSDAPLHSTPLQGTPIVTPGTIRIVPDGLDVTLDYVRVLGSAGGS